MKPNVILITADQFRGDCIGALSDIVVKTPFLDHMINSGVAFTRAYSATPTCIPARAALFTGLTQKSHKRVGYKDFVKWDYKNTMPECFANSGYHTQCIGKMHVWPPRQLMGFHNVELHDGFLPNRKTNNEAANWWSRVDDYVPYLKQQTGNPDADISDSGIDCNSWVARSFPYPEHTHPTNWVTTRSIDFLRRRDTTKPFFLWMSYVAPHPPLLPPKEYFDMYMQKNLPTPKVAKWADEFKSSRYPDVDSFSGQLSNDDTKRMMAGYFGLITHLDHQIGRMIRALKDENLLQNTVVVFTSDHGEMLGDHNMFRKELAFEGSVSIPLIVYDPGDLLKLEKGKRIEKLAELRDIMPTLLNIADVSVPKAVEGKNLLDKNFKRDYIHGEHVSHQGNFSVQYIVTEDFKYIWYSDSGREFLFDMKKDKSELFDLSKDTKYNPVLSSLRSILIGELKDRQEGYSDGTRLITGKKPTEILD